MCMHAQRSPTHVRDLVSCAARVFGETEVSRVCTYAQRSPTHVKDLASCKCLLSVCV